MLSTSARRGRGSDEIDPSFERTISLLRAQQEASIDGILVIDENRRVVSHNRRFMEIWRIPRNIASARDDQILLDHVLGNIKDADVFVERVTHLYSHPNETSRDEIELKDGRFLDRYSAPVVGSDGEYLGRVWFFRDVTSQKENEARLREMAIRDSLTGMYNRRHFFELTEKERERAERYGRPLSIALLDIDHFKRINDKYGHSTGDEALKALSRVCMDELRTSDYLSRLGGEEFAVVLPETDLEPAIKIAQRMREALARLVVNAKNETVGLTVSIGVATLGSDESVESLLQRADEALYAAKGRGRDCVVTLEKT